MQNVSTPLLKTDANASPCVHDILTPTLMSEMSFMSDISEIGKDDLSSNPSIHNFSTPSISEVSGIIDCSENVINSLLDTNDSCCNDITVPTLEPELQSHTRHGKGEGRPTQIFIQNKIYTYTNLPTILVKGKHKEKSKTKSISKVMSLKSDLNPNAFPFSPRIGNGIQNAVSILKSIRIENLENVIIGHLNINSLRY